MSLNKTKTYAEVCLERASKATLGPMEVSPGNEIVTKWKSLEHNAHIQVASFDLTKQGGLDAEFYTAARSDVPELGRRLKKACFILQCCAEDMDSEDADEIMEIIKELEEMPEEK
jgi:hypothetical protein